MGHAKLDKNISRLAEKLKAAPPGSQSYNIVRKLRKKLRKQKRLKEEELKAQRIRQLNIQRALTSLLHRNV